MKKIILTTIILALFMISIASAGVFEFITGNVVVDEDGDGCIDSAKCNFFKVAKGQCTHKCLFQATELVPAANCPMYLDICQSGLAAANDNLDICEVDLDTSNEDLDICDVALQQCQGEVCECPVCEECRNKYCIGDWELDTNINMYIDVRQPMTNGNNDKVELRFINVTTFDDANLELEIDNELDIAHLPETPSLTSEDTLHIVADISEGIYLAEYRYDVSMGTSVYTDEIWLWFNNGDATMFGGDPSYEYVTVFYKDGASVEWFGSQTLDVGSEDLFIWMTGGTGYTKSFGLTDVTPDEIVIDMTGSYGLETHWALDNGDFSHLGELPTTDDPCELELTT